MDNPISPQPVQRTAFAIIFDPFAAPGKGRISSYMSWFDPNDLIAQFIDDINEVSGGLVQYSVPVSQVVDRLPVKADGFTYTDMDAFAKILQTDQGFHTPDKVNYSKILQQFNIVQHINAGDYDEVWLFGPPYAGFFESCMGGPGAFWCNGDILNAPGATRRFVVMGFSYKVWTGNMLESYGHRVEFTMKQVFRNTAGDSNLFDRFSRYDQDYPGKAEVGSVHFAPNSTRDYEWNRTNSVPSFCDNWYHFPDLSGPAKMVNNTEWGGGEIRAHHMWWMKHFPRVSGTTNGISNNWWDYIANPDNVK